MSVRVIDRVLGRVLDEGTPSAVRHHLVAATAARMTTNAVYRYTPPFILTVARGLDVSLNEMGVALAVTDLVGLSSPLIGRFVDRVPRRWSMTGGLAVIAAACFTAAASTGLVMFTVALLTLSLAKIVFDVGLGAWIADHVPFTRRSRVTGITETSWALGLLVGVSVLGLVTTVSSWRTAFVVGGLAVAVMALVISRRIATVKPAGHAPGAAPITRLPLAGWLAVAGMFGLMSGGQTLFITFGPWLEDEFGFSAAGIAAVTFGLGAVELVASLTSAARTDRWGKERSVAAGALVMVPAALALALWSGNLVVGLALLVTFVAAFEFSIVSALPIGAELVPGLPGRGIGTMLAFGTVGRALMAVPSTRLYEEYGITPAACLGAGAATLAGLTMWSRHHALHR